MRDPKSPVEEVWLRRSLAAIRFVRHPAFPGLAVMSVLVLAGFAAVALAWKASASLLHVALQLPYVVSGGLGGLALIGVGLGLLYVQMGRRDAAREQRMTREILDEIALLRATSPQLRRLAAPGGSPWAPPR